MTLTTPEFLDLVHYYRLSPESSWTKDQAEVNTGLSGPRTTLEKPQMMTEAAKAIAVPFWWKGSTTYGDAKLLEASLRGAR